MTDTTITVPRDRALPWDALGFTGGVLLYLVNLWRHQLFVHDDTFISLRYARNLAQHGELSWNLGERVEGYTNFLHVISSAGLIRLGLDPVIAAQVLNLGAAVLVLVVVAQAGRLIAPQHPAARAAATAMVGATPGLAIWTLGGLEAVPVAALLGLGTLGLLILLDGRQRLGLLLAVLAFSAAVLTRLDAAVFIAGAGLGLLIAVPGPWKRRLGIAALVVALPAAVAFLHMGWRAAYYGELLPLTFHAKTGLPTLQRLSFFPRYLLASLTPALLVSLGLLALIMVARVAATKRLAAVLGIPVLGYVAYVGWAGGDHMLGARLFLPVLLPSAMLVLLAATTLFAGRARQITGLALGLIVVSGLQIPALKQDDAAFFGRLLGQHFADTLPAGSTIALHTAGSTPYFATSNTFIDMLGLNDPHIARRDPVPLLAPWQSIPGHGKGDGAYVMARQPDVVVLGPARGIFANDDPWFLSDVELADDPEFLRCYAPRVVQLEPPQALKRRGAPVPWPVQFVYYQRSCA